MPCQLPVFRLGTWSRPRGTDFRKHEQYMLCNLFSVYFNCQLILQNIYNKANLRDLIAATGLVIWLKLDSNRRSFSPCDLEIWWMTSKNYRAPLLHYIKLRTSSQTPRWIQTGVTDRKRSIRVKTAIFLSSVTLKFNGWPWKTIRYLLYTTLSFVHHLKSFGKFKIELQCGNTQFRQNRRIFVPCDLEIWWMTLNINRGHLLCCFKLSASFHSHRWIKTKVTVWKRLIRVKISNLLSRVTLNLMDDLNK